MALVIPLLSTISPKHMPYRVIPVMRTPHGVDVFDYEADTDYQAGDAVWIPFRSGKMLGIVLEKTKTSNIKNLKKIAGSYAGLQFSEDALLLSQWLAKQTFTSLPSIWKSWLRDYPKKPSNVKTHQPTKRKQTEVHATWQTGAKQELIAHAMRALQGNERILIITPWKHRAAEFAAALDIPQFTSDLNAGDTYRTWTDFASGDTPGLVTTRVGAWTGMFADRIFLDIPEQDDHKQDELAPRFDARKIALRLAELKRAAVGAFGLNPPLHSDETAPRIDVDCDVIVRQRAGYSRIPMIQEVAYQKLLDEDRAAAVVFHPIKFELAKLTCRDCGWHPICKRCDYVLSSNQGTAHCKRCNNNQPMPEQCGKCGSIDLGKSMPGIDKLKRVWNEKHPDIAIEWRGVSAEELDRPLPKKALVLLTDSDLLAGAEDIRKNERLCHAFRRLAASVQEVQGTLIIQTSEQSAHLWKAWLTAEGYAKWRTHERKARELFNYPPSQRVIKVLMDSTEAKTFDWMHKAEKTFGKELTTRGPFEVPFRTKDSSKRYCLHLLPTENKLTEDFLDRLAKLITEKMYIDLDPVAFFR